MNKYVALLDQLGAMAYRRGDLEEMRQCITAKAQIQGEEVPAGIDVNGVREIDETRGTENYTCHPTDWIIEFGGVQGDAKKQMNRLEALLRVAIRRHEYKTARRLVVQLASMETAADDKRVTLHFYEVRPTQAWRDKMDAIERKYAERENARRKPADS